MIIYRNLFAFGYLFCFYLRFVILMCLTLHAKIIIIYIYILKKNLNFYKKFNYLNIIFNIHINNIVDNCDLLNLMNDNIIRDVYMIGGGSKNRDQGEMGGVVVLYLLCPPPR